MADEMNRLVGVDEAANVLGVSNDTIRRMLRKKELSHVRIGRRILFDPKILEDFIDRNRVPATAV